MVNNKEIFKVAKYKLKQNYMAAKKKWRRMDEINKWTDLILEHQNTVISFSP